MDDNLKIGVDVELNFKETEKQSEEAAKQISKTINKALSADDTSFKFDTQEQAIESLRKRIASMHSDYSKYINGNSEYAQSFIAISNMIESIEANTEDFKKNFSATATAMKGFSIILENTSKLQDELTYSAEDFEAKLKKLGQTSRAIKVDDDLKKQYADLFDELNNFKTDGVFDLGKIDYSALEGLEHKLKLLTNEAKIADSIMKELSTTTGGQVKVRDIQKLIGQYNTIINSRNVNAKNKADAANNISTLKELQVDLENNVRDITADYNKVQQAYVDLTDAIGKDKLKDAIEKSTSNLDKLISQINTSYDSNSKIKTNVKLNGQWEELIESVKIYKASLGELDEEGNEIVVQQSEVDKLNNKFKLLTAQTKEAGYMGERMSDAFASNIQKFTEWFSIAQLVSEAVQKMKEMYTNVVNLDSAMVELKKVTDETNATYNRFLNNAAKSAQELAVTLTDIVNSTADFARLGYNINDAFNLAKVATVYTNVGDIGIDEATQSIVSAMKAFNIEAENAIQIVDKYNKIGNEFGVSSASIGQGMEDASAALYAAGNTIDESIAMFTGMNEVLQDTSKSSTALRTIAMRLRKTAVELQDAGEDSEGAAESISTLREQIMGLSGVDIMVNDNQFKSTTQILRELAGVWDKLEDTDQAAITNLVAGVRQANSLSAVLSNWKQVEVAIQKSENATGSAMQENEKYLQSINGKLEQLSAQWEVLSNDFIDSDLVKLGIDALRGLLAVLDELGASSVLAIGGITTYIQNSKEINKIAKDTSSLIGYVASAFKETKKASDVCVKGIGNVTQGFIALNDAFPSIALLGKLALVTAAVTLVVKGLDALIVTYDEHIAKMEEASNKYQEAENEIKSLTDSLAEYQAQLDGITNGTLDPVAPNAVENLNTEITLLKAKLALQEESARIAKEQMEAEAVAALNSKSRTSYVVEEGTNPRLTNRGNVNRETVSILDDIQRTINDTVGAWEELQKAQAENVDSKTIEELGNRYDNLLTKTQQLMTDNGSAMDAIRNSTNTAFSEIKGQVNEVNNSFIELTNLISDEVEVKASRKVNNFVKTASVGMQSLVDSIDNSISTLRTALGEMESNGRLSLGTISKLVEEGNQHLLTIDEETGLIKLNTIEYKANIQAQLQEAITKTALRNIELSESIKAETQALKENANAWDEVTRATSENFIAQSNKELQLGEQRYAVLMNLFNDLDKYITSSTTSTTSYSNEALDNYLKLINHKKAMDKYNKKELKLIEDYEYAYKKLCKTAEERHNLEQLIYQVQKDQAQRLVSELEEQQDAVENLLSYVIDMIKKEAEEERDEINKTTEAYKKKYEAAKKAIQDERDAHDYEKELAKKEKAVADIEAKLIALSKDDSFEAQKLKLQLEEELAEKRDELNEYQYDHRLELEEEALDEEMSRFEEQQQQKIDVIEAYLDNEYQIRLDAMKRIETAGSKLYDQLLEYNKKYSDGVSTDIEDAWTKAQEAMVQYNNGQKSVQDTLDILIAKQKELNEVTALYYTDDKYTSKANQITDQTDTIQDFITNSIKQLEKDVANAKKDYEELERVNFIMPNAVTEKAMNEALQTYQSLQYQLDYMKKKSNGYATGGVNTTTGLAMLHGTRQQSEVIFNAEQARKLFNYVDNLPSALLNNSNLSGTVASTSSMSIGKLMEINVSNGGVVDQNVIPQIKQIANQVMNELQNSVYRKGYRNNSLKYTI